MLQKENIIDVSVIIVNYNTPDLLFNCLKSIYKYTNGLNFEIIVVDNNSSNFDLNYFKTNFTNTEFIISPSNVGFAAANNLGIKNSKGSFILLLNSDTELHDNVIKEAYLKLLSNKQVGVITTKLIDKNGNVQSNVQKFPSIKTELIELFRINKVLSPTLKRKLLLGDYVNYNQEVFADWVWGTFFLFSKNQMQNLKDHELSQRFFMYFEDLEWCYLFNKLGLKILYSPCGSVLHHSSASTQTTNENNIKIQMQVRNFDDVLNFFFNGIQKRIYYLIRGLKYISYFYMTGNYKAGVHYAKQAFK